MVGIRVLGRTGGAFGIFLLLLLVFGCLIVRAITPTRVHAEMTATAVELAKGSPPVPSRTRSGGSALTDPTIGQVGGTEGHDGPVVLAEPSYLVPAGGGTITHFSFESNPTNAGQQLAFLVLRPGPVAGDFTVIGNTGLVALQGTGVETFPADIPVQGGDILGYWLPTFVSAIFRQPGSFFYGLEPTAANPAIGQTLFVFGEANDANLNLSATFEPAPAITSISPPQGPTSGGTLVTLTGSGFTGATAVSLAGEPVAFTVLSDTEIKFTTPAHAAGPVDVTVTNAGGTSNAETFTYVAAPTIISISPTSGPAAGGTVVTVSGSGFVAGTTVTVDNVSGIVPTSIAANGTSLTFVTPAHAAGPVDVTVTNAGGTSNAETFTYEEALAPETPGPGAPSAPGLPNTGEPSGGSGLADSGLQTLGLGVLDVLGLVALGAGRGGRAYRPSPG